jgi:hypothetical protein
MRSTSSWRSIRHRSLELGDPGVHRRDPPFRVRDGRPDHDPVRGRAHGQWCPVEVSDQAREHPCGPGRLRGGHGRERGGDGGDPGIGLTHGERGGQVGVGAGQGGAVLADQAGGQVGAAGEQRVQVRPGELSGEPAQRRITPGTGLQRQRPQADR